MKKIFLNHHKKVFYFLIVLNFFFITLIYFYSQKRFTDIKQISILKKEFISFQYPIYRSDKLTNEKLGSMTIDQKIAQMMFVSFPSGTLDENTKKLARENNVGGFIIMSANVSSKPQLTKLVEDLKKESDLEPFIATDQEGGLVARIPWDETRHISQPHIGVVDRADFAYETGLSHALSLSEFGIDVNFAPVLDISFSGTSAMASRTLGSSPQKVSLLGEQIIKAHHIKNIMTTAKHFPGIGRSSTDSHNKLPTIDITKDQLVSEELLPFQTAISSKTEFIMSGHALYPQIDPTNPASLSSTFLKDILREELGFEGIVISDDLNMGALNSFEKKCQLAVNAGNDMIIMVSSYDKQVLCMEEIKTGIENGEIDKNQIDESVKRILTLKYLELI